MKNLFIVKILIVSILFLSSCEDENNDGVINDKVTTSNVLVINGIPADPVVNYRLTQNGEVFGLNNGLAPRSIPFKTFTKASDNDLYGQYIGVLPNATLGFSSSTKAYGTQNIIATLGNSFAQDKFYTAIAYGNLPTPSSLIIEDDLTAPSSGQAKIRMINLVPDNTTGYNLLTNAATTVITGNNYGTATPFIEITPGTYTFLLRRTGTTTNYRTRSVTVDAGKIVTFYITGTQGTTASGSPKYVAINYVINRN